MPDIIFLVIALIAGVSMAIQGSLNSVLGKIAGLWEATFVVHIIATILVAIIIFILNLDKGDFTNLVNAPWYTYLGGALNVIILYGVVISIPQLGVANATTAIIVGQVTTAVIIDHFGFWGLDSVAFHWIKLVGVGLLAFGARLLLSTR
ncbi:DMT family transporter [Selenihalanaerobacter shriftii]|uniref:Transporter family-2 protein n=1 Tax=Selenihalanaerobacter shriftii TaxID=142842 RepID=A0A1T4LU71_9FIRM|nr:DMT family transporter [Selenihalanaerobacter shriftii]SJZ58004.1 transporter family-2 protein [Selenihalanaerobacter shriftii]